MHAWSEWPEPLRWRDTKALQLFRESVTDTTQGGDRPLLPRWR